MYQMLVNVKALLGLKYPKDSNILIVAALNPTLSPIDQSPRQKTNKETSELISMIDQMDLTDMTEYFTKLLHNTHSSQ
jgi:hypothetical protein